MENDKNQIKQYAIDTFEAEAAAVRNLSNLLTDDFAKAVEAILKCTGKVVVTGMGKSGIIGKKIAATLASTGTPSFFLHPGEAYHGDLGMIREEDVVICVSKSGNTPEIKVLIPLIRNNGNNNIVAMVSNTDSFLAKNSLYVLKAKVEKEACPLNLAPTNSTTAQLVLGDALAMCLVECRSFSSRDFARFHPGGSLGKRLYTRVSDVYDGTNRPCITREAGIRPVILAMSKGRLGAVAIVDGEERLEGIITDGDLRRMMEKYDDVDGLTAKDVMSKSPKTISEDELAYNAYRMMEQNSITQLVVVDKDRHYKGMVHIHDILREGVV